MTALEMVWATSTAAAVLLVLGVPLTWAVGLRGYWLIGAAPAFALTMIAGTSVIAPWLGMTWSLLPVVLVTIVVGAGLFLLRQRLRPREAPDSAVSASRWLRVDPWVLGVLLASAAVIAVRVIQIIGSPENISQTFDNIFHLNGVRFALSEGNASPLYLGYMTSPDGSLPFYPSAWHAFTSIVVQISGVSVPIAVNAVVLTTCAFIWPVSVLLLTRTLFGGAPPVTIATGAIAASLPGFPFLLMDYGVLYPLQLSLAVLPVALSATLVALRLVRSHAPTATTLWILIVIGTIPGMTLAHPGAFVAWLALSAPMAVAFSWILFRRGQMRARLLVIGGFALYLVVGVLLIRVLRPPLEARLWPTQMSVSEAIWTVASVSMWYLVPALVIAVAVIAGIVWAMIDRRLPGLMALSMYLVGALLFVAVASFPWGNLRDALTGSWYNNLPRLAAITAISLVPIAVWGIARTWAALSRPEAVRSRLRRLPSWSRGLLGVAGGVALLASMQAVVVPSAVAWAQPLYRLDDDSALLTADEYRLLTRLPEHVPEGSAVAGSPWTGASLAFAIGDRPVLMPHTLMYVSEAVETINDGLDTAVPGSEVCQAVSELGVEFVLDFGDREVHNGEHIFLGLDDLAESDRVRLVDEEGDARLYEIEVC